MSGGTARKGILGSTLAMALALLLAFGLAVSAVLPAQQAHAAEPKAGGAWELDSAGWWYRNSDGSYPAGQWGYIGGSWYLFDGSGYMRTGWANVGGTWYYLDDSGTMAEGWRQIGGTWYYLDGGGAMAEGWRYVGDAWYYLNPGSGAMAEGWKYVGGAWYYLAPGSGAMAEGWRLVGDTWYYLNPGSGAMAVGWKDIGGTWYYLNSGGDMAEGWKNLRGVWYYLVPGSGSMAEGWQTVGSTRYYLAPGSGAMVTGWLQLGKERYYLNAGGDMAEGWKQFHAVRHYFRPGSGVLATGWVDADGRRYYMDGSGAAVSGWQEVSGSRYHFDPSGVMTANAWVEDRWLTGSGAMAVNAWVDGGREYVDFDGIRVPGFKGFQQPLPAAYDKALDQWISGHISAGMTTAQKVGAIQSFIAGECAFSSANSSAERLLQQKRGDSAAGARLLADLCTKLGIRAEVRSAGDDVERYHIDYAEDYDAVYASGPDHSNTFVWISDVQYVADAQPGTCTLLIKWDPGIWEQTRQVVNGEIAPALGPCNRDPVRFTTTVGGKTYLGGYNVEVGLTTTNMSITDGGVAPGQRPVLRVTALGHQLTDVNVSDGGILAIDPSYKPGDLSVTVTLTGKGTSSLVLEIDGKGPLFHQVTVS